MPKLNESLLKETLIGIVETCRAQFIVTSQMSSEVAALLEKAHRIDPDFADLLKVTKEDAETRAEAHGRTYQEALGKFDETLRALRDFLIQ